MRLNKVLVLLAAAALFGWGLGASKEPLKIGIVDLEQAVTSTEKGKSAREELERKVREAESELAPLVNEFQESLKELESKKFVLSDQALRDKQLALQERRQQIQIKEAEVKGQLQIHQERLLSPMREKLTSIINDIGRKDGFSLILLRRAPGVMYTREALDITDRVVEKFNKS